MLLRLSSPSQGQNIPLFYEQILSGYDIVNFINFQCLLTLRTEGHVFNNSVLWILMIYLNK